MCHLHPLMCKRKYREDAFSNPQGNVYKTKRIGDQEWMADNLLYDVGDGCYCYENDPALCEEMGSLQMISPHNYPKANACSVRLVRDGPLPQ